MTHVTCTTARERGFTIVEVIIAALLLVIVTIGATAALGSSSRTMGVTKVRDKQTTIANTVLSKTQSDTSWAAACAAQTTPTCDLSSWVASAMPDVSSVTEGSQTLEFRITATASGTDLEEDGLGVDDADGVRPDLYRMEVVVSPSPQLAARFDNLKPVTLRGEYNPSIRVKSGRVVVDVCVVHNQVDERLPIGQCTPNETRVQLLPPALLDTSSPNGINTTCMGPPSSWRGASGRDCLAYKCASFEIQSMTGRGGMGCDTRPGWLPPDQWASSNPLLADLTSMRMSAGQGTVTLQNATTGQSYGPMTLVDGRVEFRNMPVGEYTVTPAITGAVRRWRSKSVPSSGTVSVEAGLKSRAVVVFRPDASGQLDIGFQTIETTVPWEPVTHPGWITFNTPNPGVPALEATPWQQVADTVSLITDPEDLEVCLVPVPQGRLSDEDVPCFDLRRDAASSTVAVKDLEPGLYAAFFHMGEYEFFYTLDHTSGYIYIPPDDEAIFTTNGRDDRIPTYSYKPCIGTVNISMVAQAVINPINGQPIRSCSTPGPTPPPGGSGGGGAQ